MLSNIFFDILIFQQEIVARSYFLQHKLHHRNDRLSFESLFEDAITISKTTLFISENTLLSCTDIDIKNLIYCTSSFHSICTDILDRCGSYSSRNICQIFNSSIVVTYRPIHKITPLLTCSDTHRHRSIIFSKYMHSHNSIVND